MMDFDYTRSVLLIESSELLVIHLLQHDCDYQVPIFDLLSPDSIMFVSFYNLYGDILTAKLEMIGVSLS